MTGWLRVFWQTGNQLLIRLKWRPKKNYQEAKMDEEEIILTIINEEEVKRLVLLLMLREFSSGTLSSFTQVPGCWCPKSNQTGWPHRRLLAVKACSSSCLLLPWLRHDHSLLQDFSGGEIYRTGGPQSNCEAVLAKLVICQPLPAIIFQAQAPGKV